jgi:aspartate-semialdehyde dehydrogenase
MAGIRLAVLGATGAVGTTLLRVLEERDLQLDELRLLASERSAGQTRTFRGEELTVQAAGPDAFADIDVAIFSAGASRSRTYAPQAVEAGAVVVDNSSAFRMDPSVPLVVPEVNSEAAREHRGIIANPNCSTMQLVPVLWPIHQAVELEQVTVSTYQSVSGTGQKAIDALRSESRAALAGDEPRAQVYPHPIAFNALPFAGAWSGDDGYTDEELKLVNESRKIMGLPDLAVSATCVRVPVESCHSEAVWVQTRESLEPEAARDLLRQAPGVVVLDDPSTDTYPTALQAAGSDEVYVGRIRRDLGRERSLALWVVSDNLRKGAATNAVQIAELCIREGLLGTRA